MLRSCPKISKPTHWLLSEPMSSAIWPPLSFLQRFMQICEALMAALAWQCCAHQKLSLRSTLSFGAAWTELNRLTPGVELSEIFELPLCSQVCGIAVEVMSIGLQQNWNRLQLMQAEILRRRFAQQSSTRIPREEDIQAVFQPPKLARWISLSRPGFT